MRQSGDKGRVQVTSARAKMTADRAFYYIVGRIGYEALLADSV
jgi:hypothetical protein